MLMCFVINMFKKINHEQKNIISSNLIFSKNQIIINTSKKLNMTPQKRAEMLVNEYKHISYDLDDIENHKECALIVVNEISKCTMYEKQKFENDRFSENYWEEVKREIEKL